MKIGNTIYLDHQATTPTDPRVFAKMRPYFTEAFGNPHSVDHIVGWNSSKAVEVAAAQVAKMIGADSDEIVFTSGGTESNNLALLGLARRAYRGKKKRILISAIEHTSVIAIGHVLESQFDYFVDTVPVNREGFVSLESLEAMLADDVLAVSINIVNNEIGTIQDIESIANLVSSAGALLHCDAAQAPLAIDMAAIAEQVDLLSLSSHKFYGPKGIGALYIRRDLQRLIEPIIYGGGQQLGLRSGTLPVPLCVGMGAAAEITCSDEFEAQRILMRERSKAFADGVRKLPWPIILNGPEGYNRHPGNVNLQFKEFVANDILNALQPHLAASTGSACTSGFTEPSHVLRAVGLTVDDAESSIRFSIGVDTNEEELLEAIGLLENVLNQMTGLSLAQ